MSNLDPLLERNRAFAATGAHAGLSIMPKQPVFVVTCLHPRVDPAAFLGVGLGDAAVVTVGGYVYDLDSGLVRMTVAPEHPARAPA